MNLPQPILDKIISFYLIDLKYRISIIRQADIFTHYISILRQAIIHFHQDPLPRNFIILQDIQNTFDNKLYDLIDENYPDICAFECRKQFMPIPTRHNHIRQNILISSGKMHIVAPFMERVWCDCDYARNWNNDNGNESRWSRLIFPSRRVIHPLYKEDSYV